jgi:hypothetical protein
MMVGGGMSMSLGGISEMRSAADRLHKEGSEEGRVLARPWQSPDPNFLDFIVCRR